jgi:hypothetical protein
MRRIALFVAILLLAGAPAQAQPAPAGCVGATVTACVASLRVSMTLEEGLLATSLERRHAVDVNGRPLGHGIVTAIARLPGDVRPVTLVLDLTPDDRVAAATATLLRDPRPAHTEEEYAATGLYDLAMRLAGARCPDNRPLAVARFFENAVKPRIVTTREELHAIAGRHKEQSLAEHVPYCGLYVTYIGLRHWAGAADWRHAAKPEERHLIRFEQ